MKSLATSLRLSYTADDKPELTLTLAQSRKESQIACRELQEILGKGKTLTVEVKQYRKQRSRDANAYFHVLVGKLARAMNIGEDETKVNLVLDYGTVMTDAEGSKVGFKLPASVNVNSIYKYAKWFDTRVENGKEFHCYIVYEHTHNYDTKQMARLIDGTIHECKEQGIETMSPKELESLKNAWGGTK